MKPDSITIEILADGTIKTETDSISAANHLNAENFLKEMFRLAGGKSTLKFKKGLKVTEAPHSHGQHEHQH